MTNYALRISTYAGTVPGATHYRGRVTGEHPKSCHGGQIYNGPVKGQWACDRGHALPSRAEWDVEASWTPERYERWADHDFEGPGPAQFSDEEDVLRTAAARFLGQLPQQWFEEAVPEPGPGDKLWHGHVSLSPEHIADDGWGGVLAVKP